MKVELEFNEYYLLVLFKLLLLYNLYQFIKTRSINPSFSNQTIWITGASSGIGQHLVYQFLSKGADKVIISARNQQQLQQIQLKDPNKIIIKVLDFSDPQKLDIEVQSFLQELNQKKIKVDIIVNNAGMANRDSALNYSYSFEETVFKVNFLSHTLITKLLIQHSLQYNSGLQIVNMSSVQGKFGIGERASYSGSKHAMQGYFDSLRVDLQSKYGNRFNVLNILPGYVQTDFGQQLMAQNQTKQKKGFTVEQFTERMLKAVFKKEQEVIIDDSFQTKMAIFIRYFNPDLLFYIMKRRQQSINK